MSIEADFYNTNAKFKSLDVENQEGYKQNYLKKIVWRSAVLSGSDLEFSEAEKLFESGLTSSSKNLFDYETVFDLYAAYKEVLNFAKSNKVLTFNDINNFYFLMGRRTVFNGKCERETELNAFCEKMNIKSQDFEDMQPIERYFLSFDAYFEILRLSPWNYANERMSRLMTHFFQFRFSLFPTDFTSTVKDKNEMLEMHIKGLNNEISEFLKSQDF